MSREEESAQYLGVDDLGSSGEAGSFQSGDITGSVGMSSTEFGAFNQSSSSESGSASEGSSEGVSGMVNSTMGKAAESLNRVAGTVRSKAEDMGENQLTSAAKGTADRIETGAEALRTLNGDELMSNIESMVRERPLESLLVAAGIGYVLSRAL